MNMYEVLKHILDSNGTSDLDSEILLLKQAVTVAEDQFKNQVTKSIANTLSTLINKAAKAGTLSFSGSFDLGSILGK